MNIELKGILESLDGHIAAVQVARDLLAKVIAGETPGGVQPSVPGVQTGGRSLRTATKENGASRQQRPTEKRNGGGQKGKVEGRGQKAEVGVTAREDARPTSITPAEPGQRAKTLGGAMKLIVAAMGTFTREALREALQKDYGDEEFVADASASAFPANISYWLKNGKLEENSAGVLKVLDKEFFGSVEFK